jgi:Sulfotransferase domain
VVKSLPPFWHAALPWLDGRYIGWERRAGTPKRGIVLLGSDDSGTGSARATSLVSLLPIVLIRLPKNGRRRKEGVVAEWPNLFIVGAAKAGTTSVYQYLDQHPDVYMSPMKEPHFFSRIEPAPSLASFFPHIKDERSYLALFERAGDARARGEASTSYLSYGHVPAAIKAVSPNAKIVIMLRNPISRAYSNYWNDVREGFEKRSFEQAVTQELAGPPGQWGVSSLYVDGGLYADRVALYFDAFGDSVLVLFFEEFIDDPVGHVDRILAFLGLDEMPDKALNVEARNVFGLPRNAVSSHILGSGMAREFARHVLPRSLRMYGRGLLVAPAQKPPLDPNVRRRLHDVYRRDVDDLRHLLHRQLPWPEFEAAAD